MKKITAIDLLEKNDFYTSSGVLSKRHRIKNNLLGVTEFIPVIRKTKKIEHFIAKNFSEQTQEAIGKVSKELISRAASVSRRARSFK